MHFFSNILKLSFLLFFMSIYLYSSNVERLLTEFNQKNDLSQRTIDENKGHLILFTRDKLEKMHAKTLKDVFKTAPVIYYHENRYGLPDPLAGGTFTPYLSNFIRLYIDGVEITQGWMGSGLLLYGDVNIDFVDHIEFYYAVPSFETAVEPAYLTIFLYSKNPKRDNGGKLSLVGGSRGDNTQSINYGEEKEDFSYMVNFSHTNSKREKIDNATDRPLSRDFERTQLFSYVKADDQIFHLQVMKKETDSLAGLSYDATPLVSEIDYLNIHMDYGIDFSEHWRAQFAYDWLKADIRQEDDFPLVYLGKTFGNSFNATTKNSTYSAELTYKEQIEEHHITAGVKGRIKELDSISVKGYGDRPLHFSKESIWSAFFQDQYALSDAELLTLGVEYSKIYRNLNIEEDDLLQLRLGYIYTSEHWSYKTYLYRTMFALDPFSRYLDIQNLSDVKPQTTVGITQEMAYTNEDYRLRLMLLFMQDEDGLLKNGASAETKYFFTILNYDYDFDINNKMNLQLYYARYKDIFNLDKLEDYSGYLSVTNSYEKFDFYNDVVWHQNSINHKNYFDLTSSVSWNVNENLTLTLKGQNLLDKAKKTSIFRIDPATGNMLEPLKISPIDRRITLELEYLF
jgi:iron complex outermembrane receptor protein